MFRRSCRRTRRLATRKQTRQPLTRWRRLALRLAHCGAGRGPGLPTWVSVSIWAHPLMRLDQRLIDQGLIGYFSMFRGSIRQAYPGHLHSDNRNYPGLMSTPIQYSDGVASDGRPDFLPPMLVPELTVPQVTGNDLTWVADNTIRVNGVQPITDVNPNGDYAGISRVSPPPADTTTYKRASRTEKRHGWRASRASTAQGRVWPAYL
jgi:hypothetical protein